MPKICKYDPDSNHCEQENGELETNESEDGFGNTQLNPVFKNKDKTKHTKKVNPVRDGSELFASAYVCFFLISFVK